ncbi:MAG: hypothetical protein SAK29_35640 [Scytonema sp. PMC 1069.18]|nr:hypothetical protein [Scytonema sp. PMC 1069.18]MEC4881396.1 hypothetical protein [Scytonema sp. PMC 1070.18]
MHKLNTVRVGAKVSILQPAYVAGLEGVICGREVLSGGQHSERWLVQVDAEFVVSLTSKEFQLLTDDKHLL